MRTGAEAEKGERALVLSGGGSRGAYEIGVWQALREMGIRIDMVTGTSAGAINGAVIAQDAFETACSIWRELETEKVFDFTDAWKKGGAKYTDFKRLLTERLDEEKIRSSGLQLGIVTVEFPSMEPKHLWLEEIPRGELVDYLLASASCFPAVTSYEIGDSRYIDGGYSDNMPVGMAMEKNAAEIIAVNLEAPGVTKKSEWEQVRNGRMIQSCWDLGNWLKFDKNNSSRIMRLGYLDAMKSYGAYDGRFYCFIKGQMDRRRLGGAERAAAILELDPQIIYGKNVFLQSLNRAIRELEGDREKDLKGSGGFGEQRKIKGKRDIGGLESLLAKLPAVNSKTLLLLLARRLKETGMEKSLLTSRPARALLSQEINAACFLVREGLVRD